jgi:hypothetical protein
MSKIQQKLLALFVVINAQAPLVLAQLLSRKRLIASHQLLAKQYGDHLSWTALVID